ncbi:MAG: NAD(P)H-dependent glycerol-3-phosphate dehydrogenase [SAR86 cluster bacterium]
MKKEIAVLGGGSWGTVLANLAAINGNKVTLWMRDEANVESINTNSLNKKYLPDYLLDRRLIATSNIEDIESSLLVLFCVPSSSFREVLLKSIKYVNPEALLISATKGIEEKGFLLMSQILENEIKSHDIGVISGPNLALEISQNQLTGTVIASKSKKLTEECIKIFASDSFRIYTNSDPYGVELGGALKNIYAIACGIADGLQSGENTVGMIMTRGLAEMSRFAVNQGADPMTFLGLSGVGDLITTCASPLSRNHAFGKLIGKGYQVDEAQKEIGQTTEGLKTLKVVWNKSKEEGVDMPIVNSLYKIIYENEPLEGSIEKVLGTDQPKDVEFLK